MSPARTWTLPDLAQVRMDGELPSRADLPTIFDQLDYQLACQAYLWALPLVSYAQWQNQHRKVFGANDFDLVHYVTYRDRLGLITANATTPYILNFIDLGNTGPLVIEVPPGHTAGGFSDFWQREFGILGEMGPDQGRGGQHLILPPGHPPPADADAYFVHHATGMNIMFGFRTLDPDPERARALVEQVRVRPMAGQAPPTRLISPAGRTWSGDQPRGLDYWIRLHDIYQHEIVDERDRFYLAMLRQLGIEKGTPFRPDERLTTILTAASASGELMAQANTFAKRFPGAKYRSDRTWDLAVQIEHSDQRGQYEDQLLERASWFYEAVSFSEAMKSTIPGVGQAYLSTYTDADGNWLDGGAAYVLHIPADPPATLFWSVTVYDASTRCLIDNEQQRGDRGSRDTELVAREDGSVDVYFGPTPPPAGETNWIQTIPGKHWFSYFRLYGPLESYFDRSWKLGDITRS
ncbi:DUF1254 domain-containing protein [Nocardia aurantia]|uniref:DUF1254 domain-containing protein n=1 Tax=Nocardia aurantia TaxID=2585199 RepID=A0A7K0E090_9NOCA|nr:DUF1254 domain-containing protein [Nocardia aurantia]MQY30514.1 hypothetical protein [Nocardia aurantia]